MVSTFVLIPTINLLTIDNGSDLSFHVPSLIDVDLAHGPGCEKDQELEQETDEQELRSASQPLT